MGSCPTPVSQADIIAALDRASALIPNAIPYSFFLTTARIESGWCLDKPCSDGGVSCGLFQLNTGELAEAGYGGQNIFDLDVNTQAYMVLANQARANIRAWKGLVDEPDPLDIGAYLRMYHKCTPSTVSGTLNQYPTGDPTILGWDDWVDAEGTLQPGYKTRNASYPDEKCGCCNKKAGSTENESTTCGSCCICYSGDACLYDPVTTPINDTGGIGFAGAAALIAFTAVVVTGMAMALG